MSRAVLDGQKKAELYSDIKTGMEEEVICELYGVKPSTLKKFKSELMIADEDMVVPAIDGSDYSPKEIADGMGVSLTHIEAIAINAGKQEWLEKHSPKPEPKRTPKPKASKKVVTLRIEGGDDIEKIEFPEEITITLVVKKEE